MKAPDAMRIVRVIASIDVAAVRALFPDEKPPVRAGDWDESGYVVDRHQALAQALGVLQQAHPDRRFVLELETRVVGAPLAVRVADSGPGDEAAAVGAAVAQCFRRVIADVHAWRRFLRPAYFEHYRSWRSRVGAPIAH